MGFVITWIWITVPAKKYINEISDSIKIIIIILLNKISNWLSIFYDIVELSLLIPQNNLIIYQYQLNIWLQDFINP